MPQKSRYTLVSRRTDERLVRGRYFADSLVHRRERAGNVGADEGIPQTAASKPCRHERNQLETAMEHTAMGNTSSSPGTLMGAGDALNKASSGAHAAVNSLAEAADGAARKAKPVIDQVAARAHDVVDKAAATAAPAADWLGEKGDSLNAAQKKLIDDTAAYISANPLMSVAVAMLAGFVISRVIRT
jgi:ElaB/YqjD/DUF883 family membrane-anchored ribosome-binding protein